MANEERYRTGSRGGFDRERDRPREELGRHGSEFEEGYGRGETERGWEQGGDFGRTDFQQSSQGIGRQGYGRGSELPGSATAGGWGAQQSYGREGEFGGYGSQSYGTESYGSRQDYGTSQGYAPQRWNQSEIGRSDFDRGTVGEPIRHGRGMRGRGPKGFQRSDDRILEAVSEALEQDDYVDATNIQVTVIQGEVTLSGSVEDRSDKRHAEDVVENVPGVRNVQNQIRIGAGKETPNIATRIRQPSTQTRNSSRNR